MKYYAVRKGRKTGIFTTWKECKESVNKFSGAEYMSFLNKEDAEKYLKNKKDKNLIEEDSTFVYTDGACSNNGKENCKAGIGVYFGEDDSRNVSRRIKGKQTNNTAEVKAIIEVYKILKKEINSGERVTIVSDSIYAIRAATTYGKKITEDKPNYKLVKTVFKMFEDKENVDFIYIKAHTKRTDGHYFGNSKADELAVKSLN